MTFEKLGERLAVQDLTEDTFHALGIDPWKRVTTLDRVPRDDLAAMSSNESAARYPESMGKLDHSVYGSFFRHALGLDDSLFGAVSSALVWPKCKVVLAWCDMTLVDCIVASATVVKLLTDGGSGIKRKVEVEKLAGANHFVSILSFYESRYSNY